MKSYIFFSFKSNLNLIKKKDQTLNFQNLKEEEEEFNQFKLHYQILNQTQKIWAYL